MVRLGVKVGTNMYAREGDGEGDPTDKESENDDWPFFFSIAEKLERFRFQSSL
jgi:hypothetical protein